MATKKPASKGMHKMPSGKMMPNNVMKKHQRKMGKKKGY